MTPISELPKCEFHYLSIYYYHFLIYFEVLSFCTPKWNYYVFELTPLSLGNVCLYIFGCNILFDISRASPTFLWCWLLPYTQTLIFIHTDSNICPFTISSCQHVKWVSLIHKSQLNIFYSVCQSLFFYKLLFNRLHQTIIYRVRFEFIILLFAFFLGHPFPPSSALFELILFYS